MTTEMPDEDDDDSDDVNEEKVHPQKMTPREEEPPKQQVVVLAGESSKKTNRRLTISIMPPTYPVSIISSGSTTVPTIDTHTNNVTPPAPSSRAVHSVGFLGGTPGIFSRGISMQTVFMASSPFKPVEEEDMKKPPPKSDHMCTACCRAGGCCPMVMG